MRDVVCCLAHDAGCAASSSQGGRLPKDQRGCLRDANTSGGGDERRPQWTKERPGDEHLTPDPQDLTSGPCCGIVLSIGGVPRALLRHPILVRCAEIVSLKNIAHSAEAGIRLVAQAEGECILRAACGGGGLSRRHLQPILGGLPRLR